MSLYNTVPDLESEPLVAAPPRKHGKAMLAVVAALAFGAGALAPSAVSRVSQMKMFQYTTGGVTVQSTTSADGGEEVYISTDGPGVRNGGSDSKIDIDGSATEGATTETGTEEFGIAGCGGPGQPECAEDATASSGCPGGETASANCGKGVVVQGDANANGAAPDISGRK